MLERIRPATISPPAGTTCFVGVYGSCDSYRPFRPIFASSSSLRSRQKHFLLHWSSCCANSTSRSNSSRSNNSRCTGLSCQPFHRTIHCTSNPSCCLFGDGHYLSGGSHGILGPMDTGNTELAGCRWAAQSRRRCHLAEQAQVQVRVRVRVLDLHCLQLWAQKLATRSR